MSAVALISIGNKDFPYVPSKIFEYMSTGKPIIHFYHNDDDSCLGYLQRYRNACLIDLRNPSQHCAKIIRDFLHVSRKKMTWSEIEGLFPMNEAKFTKQLIMNKVSSSSA